MADTGNDTRPCWFVGANYHGTDDQTLRFVSEGIWDHALQEEREDYYEQTIKYVKSMQPGDRIAIKSWQFSLEGLPFDNHGQNVHTLRIKAAGIITENPGDGRHIRVNWTEHHTEPRIWYFYAIQSTVWRVVPGSRWEADALIQFTFGEQPQEQDYERFLNDRKRYSANHQDTGLNAKIIEKLADYDPAIHGNLAPQARGILSALDALGGSAKKQKLLDEMHRHVETMQEMNVIFNHRKHVLIERGLIRVFNAEASDIDNSTQKNARGEIELYAVDDIINEGCFMPHDDVKQLLERLKAKKNLILQGPPGTGKTWLAKRLAYALMGEKNPHNLRAVQLHPNLSYEDFVRGWRPSGDGKLKLTDGVFMQTVNAALSDPESKFVVVIEEINRGNPAQIFGELLTLLEADKRNPADALELSYPGPDGENEPVYIPDNLYVIGTMNLADRSLALVDFALRRRFAFAALEPQIDAACGWIAENCGIDGSLAEEIKRRMNALNDQIRNDGRLGKQFCIGHSYVIPPHAVKPESAKDWFRQVVETEIFPLLEEYWFDDRDKAEEERDKLLAGWG